MLKSLVAVEIPGAVWYVSTSNASEMKRAQLKDEFFKGKEKTNAVEIERPQQGTRALYVAISVKVGGRRWCFSG